MKKIIIVACCGVLSACSSTGPVNIGKDSYMISKQSAAGGFGSPGVLKAEIIREGSTFCTSSHKIFQMVSSQDHPATYGSNASAEINFMCLDEGDAEIRRPKLRKEADTIIEVRK